MSPTVLLINPPVTKPCEPPAGIFRLAGFLTRAGADAVCWDANLETLLHLAALPAAAADTWTRRAERGRERHLALLRSPAGYLSPARHRRAVADLEKLVRTAAEVNAFVLGLAECTHPALSAARSGDLLRVAEEPEAFPAARFLTRRLREIMEDRRPTTVGVSLTYRNQAFGAFALLGILRRDWPGVRVMLGGGLVTSWANRYPLAQVFAGLADDFVSGRGEPAIARRLGLNPEGLPGWPEPRQFPLANYLAPGPVVPYAPSSGCWWGRCRFCPETAEGNPYRTLPPPQVVADLRLLAERFSPALFHLADNALSPALLEALVQTPPGAPWYGFARFTPRLAEPEFARALAQSGCAMLQLGLESADPAVLEAMGKGLDLAVAGPALRALHEAGVKTFVYLLFGTPWESATAARRTLDFTVAHAAWMDHLNLAVFNLPLDSPDAASLGLTPFYEGDLSLYADFAHPRGFGRKEVRRFLDREFRAHPAVRGILAREIPVFTSNHAAFFPRVTSSPAPPTPGKR